MGKIAVALTDAAPESLAAADAAELVELRIDHLGAEACDGLVERYSGRCIVTYRRSDEGGVDESVSEADRLALLARSAADDRVAYVDYELGCEGAAPPKPERAAKLIVSRHDFSLTPHAKDLLELRETIEATGADVVKIVTTARAEADCFAVYRLFEGAAKPMIALAMGEYGLATRIIGLKLGAEITFASAAEGRESAPGQVALDDMLGMYRAGAVGPATRLFGVMGDPISHSMSPAIHNAAFRELALDAVYLPFRVTEGAAEFVRRIFGEVGLEGISVTIPHKEAVIEALDEIDPVAERMGAVNTVAVKDGGLYGMNTDSKAACDSLAAALGGSLDGRSVAICGAGGAARAIVYGAADRGAKVLIANRTRSRAERLAAETGAEVCDPGELAGREFEALVNATSVGMEPNCDSCPVAEEALREGLVVFDTVYNPLETLLLRRARERGCVTVDGMQMFVGQAAAQFELWTGAVAPGKLMRSVALARLAQRAKEGG